MKYVVASVLLASAVVVVALSGCASKPADPKTSTPPAPSAGEGEHGHAGHGHAAHGGDEASDMAKMKAELAKLSPEDAQSAEKQHVCPVSGQMLGKMGAPKKIDVKGQQVWICCDACKDKLLGDPDTYLAKLKK